MKYLILSLFILVACPVKAQNISYTLSNHGLQLEANFLEGEDISLGLISNFESQSYAISVSYHPITIKGFTPYFRYSDGAHNFGKVSKMYGYDFGLQFNVLRIEHTNRHYIGEGSYHYVQFGVHLPL